MVSEPGTDQELGSSFHMPAEKEAHADTTPVESAHRTEASNLVYDEDEEPELHIRTWVALAAMFLLNMVQVLALMGPPAALNYIGEDLRSPLLQTWVQNSLFVVQAVLCPIIASASDTFQARKQILVGMCTLSFIGAAIAPGSKDISRVIAAQTMIGFGFATVPLAYCIPSEILPRKWRPMAQAWMNVAASCGACSAPLIIGALTKKNVHTGWRYFYWVEMAVWGATALSIYFGYMPPKRHTRYDHLSMWQKIGRVDLAGSGLLLAGLALFLTGLNLGGGMYRWTAAPVLVTIIVGICLLVAFAVYEWKFTEVGILHHDLFGHGKERGRTFAICASLMLIEGIFLFSYVLFYPVLTTSLFETNPFLVGAREQPYWVGSAIGTIVYGYASTKLRKVREPLFVGFLINTAGVAALASVQPGQSVSTLVYAGIAGFGYGAPLILITTGVQLSTPHHLIATATAAVASARSVSAAVFTAIFTAAVNSRLDQYIPGYVSRAALQAGLPPGSVPSFISALTNGNSTEVQTVTGATAAVIHAGALALKQAYADGIRVVFIITAPFGVVACLSCFFLGDLKEAMSYRVDAPIEDLHARNHNTKTA
ncbi:similar to MFS drug efflux pump [Paecilomyces variotii No. 5]|uniref:Similar to MFS drug efflux pump n=1 Tax=Byssochlamys spectabilis (strain No. 5 / NBRC 109023) TaxID=1356009 RepID=V5FPM7_BYSSN|nr:similar to MFS drug efflux pump [Paecilomyces variotii No. 5]